MASLGSSSLEAFTSRAQPTISIDLDGQNDGLVNLYTTGDRIDGAVSITVTRDVRFDELEITFEGTTRTSVERVALPGRTGAYQTFLRLRQPIPDSDYPMPRLLEPGRRYIFPFTFVVPDRLLPHACSHPKSHRHLELSHTLLPPTLGDAMLAPDGKSLLDDLTPDMCRIAYLIRVSVLRRDVSSSSPSSTKTLVSVAKKVRIIPAVAEEPPLNLADHEDDYCARKEKDVKRGLLRGKLGRLVLVASQPKPLQLLPTPNQGEEQEKNAISTSTTLHLRFDPVGDEPPPRLGTVSSHLRVSTFFAAEPWPDYPSPANALMWASGRGGYTDTVPLSSRCVASSSWTVHSDSPSIDDSDSSPRRCSSSSSSSSSSTSTSGSSRSGSIDPSSAYTGKTYYTASIMVPISLPTDKNLAFVPSFHSCLVSRVYALDLRVSYHPPNATIVTPSASLRLPVQITCAVRDAVSLKERARAQVREIEVSQEEVEEFFRPRGVISHQIQVETQEDAETEEGRPPEYSEVRMALSPDRSTDLVSSVRAY
ncbi:hypothetical protein EYZ11_003351 [Aspergillus tanneri]|uniref:Arrestin-like N-terminal domain-containing protein n=1 Tax=Aspergillus tanneri TaxID=1220188 RepID=A0A4S3JNH6_9EURO|nr:uncharacterized protein ATNIH1004_002384 [Aspergillus tanneri]KAA8649710.1 hypothetical protein ATNIH1004_002384 [Aspergillus tanneri]THC97186.1 hypothetical protein EYZ11_003351 [Aspergillus tanneri]